MSATRVDLPPGGLRRRAARGTVINAAFLIALNGLGFFKGFIVAAYLTTSEYGVWGLLVISLGTLLWLAQIGIEDKYVQQDHPDQEAAFQVAFTIQCVLAAGFVVLIAVAMPVFALLYGEWQIVAPGLVLALAMPAAALQTPLWALYRNMDFLRQRKLQATDPLVSFVVTIALAVAGLGYWSLVVGTLCGAWVEALAAVRASPYPLRLRWESGALREYASFSWPMFVSSASGVLIAQVPILVAQRSLGVAAVGAISLASTISLYAARVDEVVTNALYPAICAVKDRRDALLESFSKSNRLALLWGVPVGIGIALFAHDLVDFVLGDKWDYAVPLIQSFGIAAALNQLGFNWTAFYRASGHTRPMAVAGIVSLVAVMAIAVPLLIVSGLHGYAYGIVATTVVYACLRIWYLTRLFPAFSVLAHGARAMAPTVPAALAVLALRAVEHGPRAEAWAIAEVVAYVVIAAAVTVVAERALLRELVGYLRRAPSSATWGSPRSA